FATGALAVLAGLYAGAGLLGGAVDLTSEGVHTLAAPTRQALAALPEPLVLRGVVAARSPLREDLIPLLLQFERTGRAQVEWIDPEREPGRVAAVGGTVPVSLIVELGAQRVLLGPPDLYALDQDGALVFRGEEAVVNALIRLTTRQDAGVYLMTGHGEPTPEGQVSALYEALRS